MSRYRLGRAGWREEISVPRRGPWPKPVHLTDEQRAQLKVLVNRRKVGRSSFERARALLLLERGGSVAAIAERVGRDVTWVRRLRRRFSEEGLRALEDRRRTGRPQQYSPEQKCEVIAIACGKPKDFGIKYQNTWTYGTLRDYVAANVEGLESVSRSWIVKTLNGADLRPHRIQAWMHSPDPEFRPKTTVICQLYLNPPEDAVVVCVDEKTGIQALGRRYPTKMPAPGREGRQEYEYVRNGTRALIAAYNPHTGEVFGQMRARRTAQDLVEFMEALAHVYPDKEVYVVWDNLNTHKDGPSQRWTRFNERHGGRFHFRYTPIHASWVNQVELWFSILTRRILRHGVFDSTDALDSAVLGFIDYWNEAEAWPFNWSFEGYPLELDQPHRRAA